MKVIYVILIGLVMFNFMLVFTDTIGLFPGTGYTGDQINTTKKGQSFTDMDALQLVTVAVGGLDPFAALAGAGVFALAIGASIAFRNPQPLAIGGFASVFTWIWSQTVVTMSQFQINTILLGAGTVGIGLLFIINVISLAGGQPDG